MPDRLAWIPTIVGKWAWNPGEVVEFPADGTAKNSSGPTATWKCLDRIKGEYRADWSNNGTVDSIQVSLDGAVVVVKDNHGHAATFHRLPDPMIAAVSTVDSSWVELLPRVNVAKDRVVGEWRSEGTELNCVTVSHNWNNCERIMLPMIVHGSYDLELSFTRHSGDQGIAAILPVGSHVCQVGLSGYGGKCHGIDAIDGKAAADNSTTVRPGTLINGKRYDLLAKVRLHNQVASIEVFLDKSRIIRWQGKESSLGIFGGWRLPQDQRLGIGSQEPTTFHFVRLRMVSGKAQFPGEAVK